MKIPDIILNGFVILEIKSLLQSYIYNLAWGINNEMM